MPAQRAKAKGRAKPSLKDAASKYVFLRQEKSQRFLGCTPFFVGNWTWGKNFIKIWERQRKSSYSIFGCAILGCAGARGAGGERTHADSYARRSSRGPK